MELYFAYGSNMHPVQMQERCPSADFKGICELKGFRLIFNRKGSHRQGAVASVEPGDPQEDLVMGVLWEIPSEDLARMDSIENPIEKPLAYVRVAVPVACQDQASKYAWIYMAFPDGLMLEPDPEYLDIILDGAIKVGLPESYRKALADWRGNG